MLWKHPVSLGAALGMIKRSENLLGASWYLIEQSGSLGRYPGYDGGGLKSSGTETYDSVQSELTNFISV